MGPHNHRPHFISESRENEFCCSWLESSPQRRRGRCRGGERGAVMVRDEEESMWSMWRRARKVCGWEQQTGRGRVDWGGRRRVRCRGGNEGGRRRWDGGVRGWRRWRSRNDAAIWGSKRGRHVGGERWVLQQRHRLEWIYINAWSWERRPIIGHVSKWDNQS